MTEEKNLHYWNIQSSVSMFQAEKTIKAVGCNNKSLLSFRASWNDIQNSKNKEKWNSIKAGI